MARNKKYAPEPLPLIQGRYRLPELAICPSQHQAIECKRQMFHMVLTNSKHFSNALNLLVKSLFVFSRYCFCERANYDDHIHFDKPNTRVVAGCILVTIRRSPRRITLLLFLSVLFNNSNRHSALTQKKQTCLYYPGMFGQLLQLQISNLSGSKECNGKYIC